MPDFIGLFLRLKERELEQRVWEMWLAKYPFMTEENRVSYEEMLNMARQSEVINEEELHGSYVDQVCL